MTNTEKNIVEVVARAIHDAIYSEYKLAPDYASRHKDLKNDFRRQARAVLSAIRDMPVKEEGILAAEKAYRHMLETRPMPHAIRAYLNILLGEVK